MIAIDAEPANRKIRTGTENTAFNLIKELIKIDGGTVDRRYVLFTREDLWPDFPPLPDNFKHIKLSWFFPFFWSQIRLGLALRKLRPHITFIPSHSIPLLAPAPFVTVVHDIGFIERPDLYKWPWRLFHRFSLNQALARASIIITPTRTVKESILKYRPNVKTPIEVVYWGIDHSLFKPELQAGDEQILEELNLLGKNYFLYIGRLEKKKNTARLVSAFRNLKIKYPDIELVLVGHASEEIDLKGTIFLGYQPTEKTSVLYRYALAFVFPSRYEGFGLVVIEAMSSGCPVIASDIPVLSEISGGASLHVDVTNNNELIEAMDKVIANPSLRENLKAKGLTEAQKYNWGTAAEQILNLVVKAAK
ncbi:MAG: hypothetical protein A3J48_00320 [Candidatus Doudnabacteria bacterium RIFCSPHIGHO2_02_FULL_46_11]|uniref:Glycosyl transferase family 1 domain-containing protein n=1 Tax=Candidatus Doudnabacteria bacterium RIFCSPHIGHO2_02_FULL_46_11 TaxID=1817832 RepID=A0A1F5P4T3_9BACT|nr:MAG: hypothetical protein A3J48_00320 [Candidatus Doudnabacteria bacterium RIFCSPHIGHO2_02_FULL_46_11]